MRVHEIMEARAVAVHYTVPASRKSYVADGSWAVVWVDVAKLDRSWSRDYVYVGPGGEGGTRTRYPDFGRWLETATVPVEMSEVGFNEALHCVSFVNGRHRFSWVRDHGAKAVPVLVPAEDAPMMERVFGTPLRQTILTR